MRPPWRSSRRSHDPVRYLTTETGTVTDTYDVACPRGKPVKRASRRNAFGNLINQTGSTPNNYLFAGEQFDPALGIYYNRARYYDQRQGRFWTMDTFDGDPESPASLHKYLYTKANPVNYLDQSGNQIDDLVSSEAIDMGLNAIAAVGLPSGPTGPAWQFLANMVIPKSVWSTLTNYVIPDAIDMGFSFSGTRPFGGASISGGAGMEALYSAKTNKWAAYLSAGLLANFGDNGTGTALAGTAGLIYHVPQASDYAGPFLNFSVPASMLPKYIISEISAGLFGAYTALSATTGPKNGLAAFWASMAAADLAAIGLADPAHLTVNLFWGSGNVIGVTVSLGPANKTPHLQLGVTGDILLTPDVQFE